MSFVLRMQEEWSVQTGYNKLTVCLWGLRAREE
jgi:hypothetical protein